MNSEEPLFTDKDVFQPVEGYVKWLIRANDHGHIDVVVISPKGTVICTCLKPELAIKLAELLIVKVGEADQREFDGQAKEDADSDCTQP